MQPDSPLPSLPRGGEAGLSRLFLAFESIPYRWLWSANAFTAMGISMRMLVQGWLVLDITDSPFWVGLAAGLQGLGLVGFGTFGGVLVDRLERRRLLMSAQVASGTLALIVGVLVVTGQIALWHILAVAISQGVLQGAATRNPRPGLAGRGPTPAAQRYGSANAGLQRDAHRRVSHRWSAYLLSRHRECIHFCCRKHVCVCDLAALHGRDVPGTHRARTLLAGAQWWHKICLGQRSPSDAATAEPADGGIRILEVTSIGV